MNIINAALGKLAQGLRLGHMARYVQDLSHRGSDICDYARDFLCDFRRAGESLKSIAETLEKAEKCRREQSMAEQALLAKTVRFYEELSRRLESFEALKHAEVATLQANAERLPELKEPAAKSEPQPCSSALGMVFR